MLSLSEDLYFAANHDPLTRLYNRRYLVNQVNEWIRLTDGFEGCIDFDLAVQDPDHPAAFKAGYDSGDHLHPSSAGYKAMADAVPKSFLY